MTPAEIKKLRKGLKPGQLSWVLRGPRKVWFGYCGLSVHPCAWVEQDGRWNVRAGPDVHVDGIREEGPDAAKTEAEACWRHHYEAIRTPKPMTDAQIIAAYKRGLMTRIARPDPYGHYDAIKAIYTANRCGWIADIKAVSPYAIGYMPHDLLSLLAEHGKLPEDEDLIR